MIVKLTPEQLTDTELVQVARREIAEYLRGQPTDDACVFALFRRAIAGGDELAWSGLYNLYHAVVAAWIAHQTPAPSHENREVLVSECFAKFCRSISPEKLKRFPSVRALLAYLTSRIEALVQFQQICRHARRAYVGMRRQHAQKAQRALRRRMNHLHRIWEVEK